MANGDIRLKLSNKQFKKIASIVLGLKYDDVKNINTVKITRDKRGVEHEKEIQVVRDVLNVPEGGKSAAQA
jgi:hypothetical protein